MKFSTACEGYLLSIRGEGYSPVTAKNYTAFLKVITQNLGDPELDAIKPDDLRLFLMHKSDDGMAGSTLQVYWKVLRSFYNWAENALDLPSRPDQKIKAPKFESPEVQPFTPEEIAKMLDATPSKRNRALIAVLLDTGGRISEVCRMTFGDLNMDDGSIQIHSYATGKKSRPRTVYLGKRAKTILWNYLATRPDIQQGDPLIATVRGDVLNRTAALHLLNRIEEPSGVKNIHPHRFRHTFAIEFLRGGGDIFTLQRLLGHRSLELVRHYLQLAESDSMAAHRKASPLDRIKRA